MTLESSKELKTGLIAALVSGIFWGLSPIYWKILYPIDSFTIILFRIVLCCIFAFIFSLKNASVKEILLRVIDFKFMKAPIIAGAFITLNWSLYIWAISNERIIETSLGYYIQPLIVCLFGVVVFKEKLVKFKIVAVAFAVIGVMVVVFYFQKPPIIPLTLAVSFATYAVLKKKYSISPMLSLFYETIYIAPLAIGVMIYRDVNGFGIFDFGATYQLYLLPFAGIVTLIPLSIYGYAAPRIPLITLGLSGYIAPTISLILGVAMYNEPFVAVQFISFGIIWIGLGIFTYGQNKELKYKKLKER